MALQTQALAHSRRLRVGLPPTAERHAILFKIGDDVTGICPTRDHRRFLATIDVEQAAAPAIAVDMHWLTALRRK